MKFRKCQYSSHRGRGSSTHIFPGALKQTLTKSVRQNLMLQLSTKAAIHVALLKAVHQHHWGSTVWVYPKDPWWPCGLRVESGGKSARGGVARILGVLFTSALLPLFTISWPLPQPGSFSGRCADRLSLWPWGQGQIPLLLEFGADRVCRAGVPRQRGLEWDRAHLPP